MIVLSCPNSQPSNQTRVLSGILTSAMQKTARQRAVMITASFMGDGYFSRSSRTAVFPDMFGADISLNVKNS